ncbi:hypothetical protein REPUB_Repub20aG0089100 [Reevesia pubescens]
MALKNIDAKTRRGSVVTSVFVNNIPKQVHWRWLWRIFSHHGKVITRLNGVWLLNSKLCVNIARFKGRSSYWRKVSKSSSVNLAPKCDTSDSFPNYRVSPGKSNADVVDPRKKTYLQAFLNNRPPSTESSPHKILKEYVILNLSKKLHVMFWCY